MVDILHAARQKIGSWYIVGTHDESPGEGTTLSILAGPFLTATESGRFVPPPPACTPSSPTMRTPYPGLAWPAWRNRWTVLPGLMPS